MNQNKLVEALEKIVEECTRNEVSISFIEHEAKQALASYTEDSGWVRVEDRLPRAYVNVLISWSKETKGLHPVMSTARFVGDCWITDKSKPILAATINHWQYLPTPPTTKP